MEFAETCHSCSFLQSQIVGTMFIDIIADGHEFFHVFFLLVTGSIKACRIAVIFSPNQYEKIQHFTVNDCLGQKVCSKVFLLDVHNQVTQLVIDVRIGFGSDETNRGQNGQHRVGFMNLMQQMIVRLENDAFPLCGSHGMNHTGTDDQDIPHL